jgi:hypothetical protein
LTPPQMLIPPGLTNVKGSPPDVAHGCPFLFVMK